MLDLPKEFSLSGFLEETEEDGTVLYVMDFPDDVYITVTDDNGRTPVRAKQNLVLAGPSWNCKSSARTILQALRSCCRR